MKYPNLSTGGNMAVSGNSDEVDSIFTSPCWQNSSTSDYIDHKLILEGTISDLGSDKMLLDNNPDEEIDESKVSMEALDNLLSSSASQHHQTMSLAELKPLPPFTGYTANLSINGIQGHHYHTISQRIPEENNNYSNFSEQNIVSSSTSCNIGGSDSGDEKLYSVDEVVKLSNYSDDNGIIKTEISEYDISSIDDIAAIIGSAIADTTVPNNNSNNNNNDNISDDPNASRDSWMDLDAWIDQTCNDQQKDADFLLPSTSEFTNNNKQQQNSSASSTLQSLLTHPNMPLLQYRLQNGPPIKQEDLMSTTASSPPNVVSTTDNLLLTVNGRFVPQYSLHMDDDILNYPHTTTTSTTPSSTKKSRSRAQKKQQQQQATSTVFSTDQTLGLLGKEKPVHRCSICNRGFLNKSNIKVHLRTHTGEKPFRCDTCAKAFRQKAHLLKHQQIHKRIGRD